MTYLYVKTTMQVSGLAPIVHLAELEPVPGAPLCRPARMLEVAADGAVTGAYRRTPELTVGMSSPPQQLIPHPDSWGDLPDIASERISATEFDALWLEANYLLGLQEK